MNAGALPAESAGATAAEAIADQVEADIELALRRRVLNRTRERAARMKADLETLVETVVTARDPAQAVAAYLAVEAARPDLVECFRAINPAFTASAAGQAKIVEMTDRIVDGLIGRLQPVLPADDPLPGLPPPDSGGGSDPLQTGGGRRMLPTSPEKGGRRRANGTSSN